jgi:hypothetical protein
MFQGFAFIAANSIGQHHVNQERSFFGFVVESCGVGFTLP